MQESLADATGMAVRSSAEALIIGIGSSDDNSTRAVGHTGFRLRTGPAGRIAGRVTTETIDTITAGALRSRGASRSVGLAHTSTVNTGLSRRADLSAVSAVVDVGVGVSFAAVGHVVIAVAEAGATAHHHAGTVDTALGRIGEVRAH